MIQALGTMFPLLSRRGKKRTECPDSPIAISAVFKESWLNSPSTSQPNVPLVVNAPRAGVLVEPETRGRTDWPSYIPFLAVERKVGFAELPWRYQPSDIVVGVFVVSNC